jgi:hypothetical protein
MTYIVAVKTAESEYPYGYKHYEVPEDVYNYILQLEGYVKNPEASKLKVLYRERFGNASNCKLSR